MLPPWGRTRSRRQRLVLAPFVVLECGGLDCMESGGGDLMEEHEDGCTFQTLRSTGAELSASLDVGLPVAEGRLRSIRNATVGGRTETL